MKMDSWVSLGVASGMLIALWIIAPQMAKSLEEENKRITKEAEKCKVYCESVLSEVPVSCLNNEGGFRYKWSCNEETWTRAASSLQE